MAHNEIQRRLAALEHATATQPPVITEIIVHLPGVDPEVPLRGDEMLLGGRWIRYREIGASAHETGDDDGR